MGLTTFFAENLKVTVSNTLNHRIADLRVKVDNHWQRVSNRKYAKDIRVDPVSDMRRIAQQRGLL